MGMALRIRTWNFDAKRSETSSSNSSDGTTCQYANACIMFSAGSALLLTVRPSMFARPSIASISRKFLWAVAPAVSVMRTWSAEAGTRPPVSVRPAGAILER